MAKKVMISLPPELLDRLDRYAREHGTSRSGLLRRLAERELAREQRSRDARVEELLGEPGHYGGCAAAEVRRLRATR
jgi:metal-responsive CopG/Arc/MetJ family transcriptional regulator